MIGSAERASWLFPDLPQRVSPARWANGSAIRPVSIRPRVRQKRANIIPCRGIVGGLTILKCPLIFTATNHTQIVHARIGSRDPVRADKPPNACNKNDGHKRHGDDYKQFIVLALF